MQNGRPADGSKMTCFYPTTYKKKVKSLKTDTDVSGWQHYSLQVDKENRLDG